MKRSVGGDKARAGMAHNALNPILVQFSPRGSLGKHACLRNKTNRNICSQSLLHVDSSNPLMGLAQARVPAAVNRVSRPAHGRHASRAEAHQWPYSALVGGD